MTAIADEQTAQHTGVGSLGGEPWMAAEETLSIRESQARLLLAGTRARLDQLERELTVRRPTGH
jgi:hypothetical protein